MRKIKKINGFLVVKFNDREKREYEGTALGEYGVIDAEVYTGNLDIDRGAMEYDDADTLEVAVELARGLESEEDITDEPPTYTAAVETNESYTEEAVEPAALIEGWTRRLATQVKSKHYPDTDPRTAAHELYGFKMALHQIGFLPESEVITDPDTFGAGRLDGPMPRNPEELLAFVCDERCKNRAGHTQEELDAICAKCPLGQLYEDAEAQDLRIRERSERALREHIEGVRHAEDTLTALLGGHEALAYPREHNHPRRQPHRAPSDGAGECRRNHHRPALRHQLCLSDGGVHQERQEPLHLVPLRRLPRAQVRRGWARRPDLLHPLGRGADLHRRDEDRGLQRQERGHLG